METNIGYEDRPVPRPWSIPLGLPETLSTVPSSAGPAPAVLDSAAPAPAVPDSVPPVSSLPSIMADVPAPAPSSSIQQRYIKDILQLQRRLSFSRLDAELQKNGGCIYRADHGHGVVTLVANSRSVPDRYLRGIAGFRLSEYLQAGFASEEIVFNRSLFCEPVREFHDDDLHVITTDSNSGRILGYVTLSHSQDPVTRPIAAEDRRLFPCEQAHDLRLQSVLPDTRGLMTHQVREVKRFVHARDVTDRSLRLRITLELLAGIMQAARLGGCPTQLLIGDVEEHVALRHLVLLGLAVHLLKGTTPRLSPQNVMHPMYTKRERVLPFYAWAPPEEEIEMRANLLEQAAASDSPFRALRGLIAGLPGTVEHIEVAA